MGNFRRIRNVAAATLLTSAGLVAVTGQPAQATVTGCVYGWNLSLNQQSATCSTTEPDRWYLRLACERLGNHTIVYVNGSLTYGPGTATSIARCPANTEIAGSVIAYL